MTPVDDRHPAEISVEHLAPRQSPIEVENGELRAALRRSTILLHRTAHSGSLERCDDCADSLALLGLRDSGTDTY